MMTPLIMNSFQGLHVLALVRDGDYAHAGEEEAIELAMRDIPKDPERFLLDAGCGRGGTAAYLQRHGWGRVAGFDIERQSIDRASQAYPDLRFVACDILFVEHYFDERFDVFTMFNVLHALPDHARALHALAQLAKPGGRLVVFDYIDRGCYHEDAILEAGQPFLPQLPKLSELSSIFAGGGWELQCVEEIDTDYERWYAALVSKIEAKRKAITDLAGAEWYDHVHRLYDGLHNAFRDGRLGGAISHGQRPV